MIEVQKSVEAEMSGELELTLGTLVNVNVAFGTHKALGAVAVVAAGDHVSLANGSGLARVGGTGIVQVAEQSRLARGALAKVVGNSVMTSTTVETGLLGTVVHVNLAVLALEAVDADAAVAVLGVAARGAVLANVRIQGALIHVLSAVLASVLGRALTRVGTHAIDTSTPVLAQVVLAVVHVDLALVTGET